MDLGTLVFPFDQTFHPLHICTSFYTTLRCKKFYRIGPRSYFETFLKLVFVMMERTSCLFLFLKLELQLPTCYFTVCLVLYLFLTITLSQSFWTKFKCIFVVTFLLLEELFQFGCFMFEAFTACIVVIDSSTKILSHCFWRDSFLT